MDCPTELLTTEERRNSNESKMSKRLWQSDAASQGEFQLGADDRRRVGSPQLTTSRLTYDTARAVGQYLAARTGVTDESVQHAVIQLIAALLLDALRLSADEAERIVQGVLAHGHE